MDSSADDVPPRLHASADQSSGVEGKESATLNGSATAVGQQETMTMANYRPEMPSIDATPSPVPTTHTTQTTQTTKPDDTLATKALRFLSNATPGTLAGVAIGFAAITYAILGNVGLLFIGAFAGVVGFIALEARNPGISRTVRGEKGTDVLDRMWLDLKEARAQDKDTSEDDEAALLKSFDDFRPETREALGGLIDAVIKDYVKWWYSPIIPTDHSFPLACRRTLTSYLLAISNRMYRKRPADSFLDLLTNSSSIVIAFMSELGAAFADVPLGSSMTAVDTVYNYLASNPDSQLANLLDQRQQTIKFRMVAEELLTFLDQNSYNCDPARVFLREILANSVLETTLQTCSKAEWINGWIVYLLEDGEPDLNQAIDVGMQTGRDAGNNVFADMDGNMGNVSIAKPSRAGPDGERGRRKESLAHRKKLSKADEEMEVAMEEMKRMNAMMTHDQNRESDSATIEPFERSSQSMDVMPGEAGNQKNTPTAGFASPRPSVDTFSPPETSRDSFSMRSENEHTPVTPRSTIGSSSPNSSPKRLNGQSFTSFDQIVPQKQEVEEDEGAPRKAPLTLHNASFTLHDDTANDKGKIRNKPTWDYLIQVEPSSSGYPGWMIVRRYSDFETLHEILRRIAHVSGATAFTELHKELPSWKIHTRESLRGELERYLRDACWYQSLAESEGMKRFLEKSQGHTHADAKAFGWETVGKNMLDVLTIAPKGAMEGGKSLVGNVSGVFGNIPGLSRKTTSQSVDLTMTPNPNRLSISTPSRADSIRSPARSDRASMDSQRSSVISTQPGKMPPMERRPSYQSQGEGEGENGKVGRTERMDSMSASVSARPSREHSRASSLAPIRSPSSVSLDLMKLPPPPDEIADDYQSPTHPGDMHAKINDSLDAHDRVHARTQSLDCSPTPASSGLAARKAAPKPSKQYSQLSEPETRVAVELIFAVINEMYTLSSAWNIRRTLLTAAKSFLLRPGNPSLLTVQTLIQSSLLDANTSDAGIGMQLRKLRENTMPTDEERATWPGEMTSEEKEKLAAKARSLLIRSGVPAALTGVMGQAATGQALGRVFDCLQVEEVARGLIFGLMLQAVRVLTH